MSIVKTFRVTLYVIGYHVYKDRWTLVKGEMLKAVVEPKNKVGKFAAAIRKYDFLVGNLSKEKTERFAKLFSIFCEPVTQTLAPGKLLEKPSIKEMEKE